MQITNLNDHVKLYKEKKMKFRFFFFSLNEY